VKSRTSNIRDADFAIERLHDKHGDDAESREDYTDADGKRWDAIDILATKPARSSNGLVAKAEVLTDRRLSEDFTSHGRIATSLGEDVLRYFGARVA
jgi:hypothetical protein